MPLPKTAKELLNPRYCWQEFCRQLKELRGKPHEISLGMAIGVFIAVTPTIPFFYYGSYRLGRFVLGYPQLALPADYSLISLMKLGRHVTVAMLHGGVLLGILPGLLAYFLTYKLTSSPRFQGKPR